MRKKKPSRELEIRTAALSSAIQMVADPLDVDTVIATAEKLLTFLANKEKQEPKLLTEETDVTLLRRTPRSPRKIS